MLRGSKFNGWKYYQIFLRLQQYILIAFVNRITRRQTKHRTITRVFLSWKNRNGRKPNNLRLEMIILRTVYNEERENMEMLSKDRNPENSLLLQYMRTSLSPKKLQTSVLLCRCATAMWNNDRLHLGEQHNLYFIIFILSFLLLAFLPEVYIVHLGFV